MIVEKKYEVTGMMCGNCSKKLNDALRFTRGVKEAKANHETGTLEVAYNDEQVAEEDIMRVVEGLGFEIKR